MKIPILTFAIIIALCSCAGLPDANSIKDMYQEQVASVGPLTDEMVVRYINTYRVLRKNGISFLQQVQKNPNDNMAVYNSMDNIVKEGGFSGMEEFVKVNAKIAWAWNISQGKIGLQKQVDLQNWAENTQNGAITFIQTQIDDPEVPEETKAELRRQIEEIKLQSKEREEKFNEGKKWADAVMNYLEPLTNDQDIAVLMRHEQELMEVYTGINQSQLQVIRQNTLDMLNTNVFDELNKQGEKNE